VELTISSTAPQPDVLICGAGPVGLALATQLVRHEISCRIIDKNEGRTELSKALALFARSLELLHSGIDAHAFVQQGIPVERAMVFSNQKHIGTLELAGAQSSFGTGIMIPQSDTEHILEKALDALGIPVERTTELTGFEDLGDRVRCTLTTGDGAETIEPAWLVGCDGAHSLVRHTLGMEFKGEADMNRWALADVRVDGANDTATLFICPHAKGLLVAFRIRDERFRIVASSPLASLDEPHVDPELSDIQDVVDERGPGGWTIHDPAWLTEFRVNERKVDDYGIGRVFVAGDAAHIHSPAGGQGMNTGVQDACNLAWKLALVHRGTAGNTLLDSYSTERSEVGRSVLANTGRMARVMTMGSRIAQAIRNQVMCFLLKRPRFQHQFRMFISELAIAYPGSPITGEDHREHRIHAGLSPGHRVPNLALRGELGADSLHDMLAEPRISLLLYTESTNGLEHIAAVEQSIPGSWKESVQILGVMSDAPHPTGVFHQADVDEVREQLGLEPGSFAVIRPDGYVALLGDAAHPECITRWLNSIGTDRSAS